jgi:hypothetical protein
MKGTSTAESQRDQATVVSTLNRLHGEFRQSQMPVEEALTRLALKLVALEYAVRYDTGNARRALGAVRKVREKFLKCVAAESDSDLGR